MTDSSSTDAADRQRLVVLIGSVVLLLISAGGMFLVVVALKEMAMEFGWPRSIPSFAFSLQFIGSGFGGMIMGYVLDRYGFGGPALIGTLMVSFGAMLVSEITAAWQLYVLYGIMFGLAGQGSLAAPALANIARWYDEKRGMAVGIASSGQALAGIVWPPIFGYVLLTLGWRDMFFWYGVFALCVMLPVCLVVRRKPPAYVAPEPGTAGASAERQSTTGPVRQPLTSQQIQWALSAAIIGCCVAMSLPLGHLVSHVTDLGHPIGDAVNVLSVMLMAAFVSRAVILGLLSDRVGALRTMFIFSIVQACMLGLFTVVDSLLALYAVAILCGLGYGGLFPIYAVATREHLPIHEVGRRTGTIFLFGAVAMGLGSWMGGYLFDLTGSYTLPFLIGVAINLTNLVIVALLILRIRPPLAFRLA
ncbi:MAG: MFS transporter [Rhodospirillaceae bacterium]|jgi:MFS family permease|nr:MFS transporter [Rhodospirillaceae bacterium]